MIRDESNEDSRSGPADDSDADAFAALSVLIIAAAVIIYWLEH